MIFLDSVFQRSSAFKTLNSITKNKLAAAVTGVSGVHKANIISSLCRYNNVTAFCVAQNESEAQTLANDLSMMGLKALVYQKKDFTFVNLASKSHEYEHSRLNVLANMIKGNYDVIISTLDAAAQFTIPKNVLKKVTLNLSPGESISIPKLEETLITLGYERCDMVEGIGQFSVRGGIVDLFVPSDNALSKKLSGTENHTSSDDTNDTQSKKSSGELNDVSADFPNGSSIGAPVRIEFWGDEIDTISYFDIETQRRTEPCEGISLSPSTEVLVGNKEELAKKIRKKASFLKSEKSEKAKELLNRDADMLESGLTLSNIDKYISLIYETPATLFDYLDENCLVFISEYKNVKERDKACEKLEKEELIGLFSGGVLCRGFETYSKNFLQSMNILLNHATFFLDTFSHSNYDTKISQTANISAKQTSPFNGQSSQLVEDLNDIGYKNYAVVILAGTEKSAKSLCDILNEKGIPAEYKDRLNQAQIGKVYVLKGMLSSGIEYPKERFLLYTHTFVNYKKSSKKKRPKNSKEIYSLTDLNIGEYVVHSTHGIGLYKGIEKIEVNSVTKDYIKIEYAKGDLLYVPVTQLDLVSKYIGPRDNSVVRLNRLGSPDWQKTKSRVKHAVKEIAKELIELYSKRMKSKGFAFSSDNEWQHDFEARFEFEETEDQLRCVKEIKHDMESSAPMDRLLCGDVGFGKTEVALRAAFKCVSDSKQCALLCPTTILAWQHYQTVLSRFDNFPIRVELLSRFKTPTEQKLILEKLKRSEIDMIIGTHRLVQKDVEFYDLGLVIIDEEQRFGVAQKERFKELKENVDVLTLSATPIPRTLNMAMSGIRDMSVIEEAPQNRHPVQTFVLEHDDAVIYEAIRRELRRGGQVYYLHNNVETITSLASKLTDNLPNVKIGIGHGKMSEQELSEVWRKMIDREIDVLVCTTIIETGVDLPNVNTLIIENADRFGLSQLYQIRGRVGRSPRRAYAYFTYNGAKILSEISQKRLTAIKEFTEFGSGFKIAMRDLELRGAGNILGGEQHGQMEDVGYDMYLKILDEAVKEEKGEKAESADIDKDCLIDITLDAHIPENYIVSLSNRLDAYRRISCIKTNDDKSDVIDEFIDRYGEIPKSVMGLIDIALIRKKAADLGIYEIKQNATGVLLYLYNIKQEQVPVIISKMKGRAMLSAGAKPYIAVRCETQYNSLEVLKEIFL